MKNERKRLTLKYPRPEVLKLIKTVSLSQRFPCAWSFTIAIIETEYMTLAVDWCYIYIVHLNFVVLLSLFHF